jgi:hypothetical protein
MSTFLDCSEMSAVCERVSVPEPGVSDVANKAVGPAVGVEEEVDDGMVEADSNSDRGRSDS